MMELTETTQTYIRGSSMASQKNAKLELGWKGYLSMKLRQRAEMITAFPFWRSESSLTTPGCSTASSTLARYEESVGIQADLNPTLV